MNKLTEKQENVLNSLVRHKYWTANGYGCGWVWDTPSGTVKLLDVLVKKGYADLIDGKYTPTELGFEFYYTSDKQRFRK